MTTGEEPYGFPVACLLRGARTIVGSLSPPSRREVTKILDHVARERPAAGQLAGAVRAAMATSTSGTARWIEASPMDGACITVWSTVALPGAGATGWRSTSWDARGLPRPAAPDVPAELTLRVPLAPEAARILRTASKDGTSCVTAAGLLGATIADEHLYAALPGARDVVRVADHLRETRQVAAVIRGLPQSPSITLTADAARAIRAAQDLARDRRLSELPVSLLVMGALADDRLTEAMARDGQAKRFGEALLDLVERRDDRPAEQPAVASRTTYDGARIAELQEPSNQPASTRLRYARRTGWTVLLLALTISGSSLGDIAKIENAISQRAAQGARTVAPAGGFLGIQVATDATRLPVIKAVVAGSPASRAGLRAGDHVRSIDNDPVSQPGEVVALIRRHQPGAVVRMIVVREAGTLSIRARTVARPRAAG